MLGDGCWVTGVGGVVRIHNAKPLAMGYTGRSHVWIEGVIEDPKGQLVLITGASSGLGKAAALHMAARGYPVIGTGRSVERLAALQKEASESALPMVGVELDINSEAHQLAVVPVLTTADEPLSDQIDKGLATTFEWLGKMKARSMIYLLAFPSGMNDDDWKAALAKAEEKYQAKAIGQMQFVIPRPPRSMVRAAAAVFLHASRIPQPQEEASSG